MKLYKVTLLADEREELEATAHKPKSGSYPVPKANN